MTTHSFLQKSTLAGIFLTLFIPFFVSDSLLFPFISGKNFAFRIIVEILLGLYLALCVYDRNYWPKKNLLLWATLIFTGVMFVADITGVHPYRSFWSNFERMEGFITLIHLFVYFVVVSAVLNTEKLWNYFLNTSVFASFLMSLYGFLQLAGKLDVHQSTSRLDGSLGNSAYMAVYMLFNTFLALFLLCRTSAEKIWLRVFYAVVILCQIIVLYYTATRGSILGFIGGLFLTMILIALFERKNLLLRKICIGVSLAIIFLVSGFLFFKDQPFILKSEVLSRFSSISLNDQTTSSRFLIWNMAWQGVKERPILGWGQENFIAVFDKYYDPRMYNQEPWFDRTHNVVLDWFIAGGFLGLISYLSLYFVMLYLIWKKIPSFSFVDKSILTGLLAGYFFHNLFVFDNLISYICFFSLLAYITHASTPNSSEVTVQEVSPGQGENLQTLVIPTVVILIPLCIYFLNIPQIRSGSTLINALQYAQVDVPKSFELFKQSLSYETFAQGEIREQLLRSADQVLQSGLPSEFKSMYLDFAIAQMKQQVKSNPFDARYNYALGQFLAQTGNQIEAQKYLEKAVALSPKKQPILLALGVSYFNTKDLTKAYEIIKRTYELEPRNESAIIIYAIMNLYSNKIDVFTEVLISKYETLLVPDDRLIATYVRTGNFEKVITLDKRLVGEKIKAGLLSETQVVGIDEQRKQSQVLADEIQKSLTKPK